MKRIFIDMDGVIVDYNGEAKKRNVDPEELKLIPGAYVEMLPIPGAIEGVRELIAKGYDVWIATKPPTDNPGACGEKAIWIHRWIPELKKRFIITFDKGLLGDEGDILIDDRPNKANCKEFPGILLKFDPERGEIGWRELLDYIIDYMKF